MSLYLNKQNNNKKTDDKIIYKKIFMTFIISYLILLICYYSYSLVFKNKSMKGGGNTGILDNTQNIESDNFTITSDDIDIGIFEDS